MCAERLAAWRFARFQANACLEPLVVLVHKRHQRNFRAQAARRHGGNRVEHRVWQRIQQAQAAQHREPGGLIKRARKKSVDGGGQGWHVIVSA